MAKASKKVPGEPKCKGSGAPIEGRDWVKIGGAKWLREVAEKQGKFIPLEYRDKSGADFRKERADRVAAAEKARYDRLSEEARGPREEEPNESEEVTVAETDEIEAEGLMEEVTAALDEAFGEEVVETEV